MKKMFSKFTFTVGFMLAISFSSTFAYTEKDFHGWWTFSGNFEQIDPVVSYAIMSAIGTRDVPFKTQLDLAMKNRDYKFLQFEPNGKCASTIINCQGWRFRNNNIEIESSNIQVKIISAKVIDIYQYKQKVYTLKKAGTIEQFRKWVDAQGKEWEKKEAIKRAEREAQELKEASEHFFMYKELEKMKFHLNNIYAEFEATKKKGDFESTADYNQRLKNIEPMLKDSANIIFLQYVDNIIEKMVILYGNSNYDIFFESDFNWYANTTDYNADKEILNVSFKTNKYGDGSMYSKDGARLGSPNFLEYRYNDIKGEIKISGQQAKALFESKFGLKSSYKLQDLKIVEKFLIPSKMEVSYDIPVVPGEEDKITMRYDMEINLPKNAGAIQFKGSELWLNNPYAKTIKIDFKERLRELKKNEKFSISPEWRKYYVENVYGRKLKNQTHHYNLWGKINHISEDNDMVAEIDLRDRKRLDKNSINILRILEKK